MKPITAITSLALLMSSTAIAAEPFKARVDINWRYGQERAILMSEFWVPIAQGPDNVLYGDLRMMGDDGQNREGNLGIGYRQLAALPFTGSKGVVGIHGWIDRRFTARGSKFNQFAAGAEWLGESVDLRLNGYLPLSDEEYYTIPNANPQSPSLIGTGIVVDTDATLLEEPQHGFDGEIGIELGQFSPFLRENTDSVRLYGGGYYFDGEHTERVTGWRTRLAADISPNIQIGGRFQRDDERGSQGFLEATFRFPFGHKKSYRREGLRARLDESPERDIDIVTSDTLSDPGSRVPVLNTATGAPQEVLHVDNTAAPGGNGSAESPFNTLAAAQGAASAHTIIYVKHGDGTSAGQNQGVSLSQTGQQLLGTGTAFLYDQGRFTTANGASPSATLIAPATSAPIIGNVNAGGDGVTISADDVSIAGVTVDNGGTGRDGIVVRADGAGASASGVSIYDVTAQNARMGIYLHGLNSGVVSAKVERSVASGNSQHGIAVYDDTDGTFEVDLGGGSLGSSGSNVLAGNTLEDLALDYDGRTLAAMNNWWGQASGPDTDTPDIGIRPQIYYGAPINDGLVGHWTFDTEWTTNTTAYDRSGQDNDGVFFGGLSLADQVVGQNREALFLDNSAKHVFVSSNASLNPDTGLSYAIKAKKEGAGSSDPRVILISRSANYIDINFAGSPMFSYRRPLQTPLIGGATPGIGIWTAFASSYDGITAKLFLNGAESVAASMAGTVTATGNLTIGRFDGGGFTFNGVIDDARVYNRALSSSEVSELYRMDTSSKVNTGSFLTSAP